MIILYKSQLLLLTIALLITLRNRHNDFYFIYIKHFFIQFSKTICTKLTILHFLSLKVILL